MDSPGADPGGDEAARLARGKEAMKAAAASPYYSIGNGTTHPDPFAPLGSGHSTNGFGKSEPEIWEPVMPVPGGIPEGRVVQHYKHGRASRYWVYRDAAGQPLFVVARFDLADGRKEVLPYCFGRRVWTLASGPNVGTRRDKTDWHFKAPHAPRPLYGLDRLAGSLDAPVLLVEGEKAADAAAVLFPELVAMTSQGGSKATDKADWSALVGRAVTIWGK